MAFVTNFVCFSLRALAWQNFVKQRPPQWSKTSKLREVLAIYFFIWQLWNERISCERFQSRYCRNKYAGTNLFSRLASITSWIVFHVLLCIFIRTYNVGMYVPLQKSVQFRFIQILYNLGCVSALEGLKTFFPSEGFGYIVWI